MRNFKTLCGIAAPINKANIDTDIIFPARFLLLMDKAGLGKHLFNEWRADPSFILNSPPYNNTKILITGERFGIGSSREQAVWALTDFGIRCIIAPSFGDIFFNNCLKNGILPIALSGPAHKQLLEAGHNQTALNIDLAAQTITDGNHAPIFFEIDAHAKEKLLSGLDEIGTIITNELHAIKAFEDQQRNKRPWHYLTNTNSKTNSQP